ncbi:MAG TPA: nucleoside-diphosphate kinase [Bacteroidetes bacterium]|nr:nucleoside diphosphate kinase [bacterium BMS3Bbin04]HDO65814.1 nucleoside-diphosphate kinase [Bacteroidota bacterium]HEX04939.1 nucleoside-diphosphate kinase [Bacteroidota bacterium]
MERTLCIIKPDGVKSKVIGKVIDRIEQEGFSILGMKRARLSKASVEDFYAVHSKLPFYGELCDFMSSAPVVLIALEREDAIAYWRKVIGATDPADAAEGTIRKMYASSKGENTVHGSDSVENGILEISKFFSEKELIEQK